MTVFDYIRRRLLEAKGLLEASPFPRATFDELYGSEWSPEFERLMRNRLVFHFPIEAYESLRRVDTKYRITFEDAEGRITETQFNGGFAKKW